jgi:hypothetical protein
MKKLLILCLLCTSACAVTNKATLYEPPSHNFSVVIPESWERIDLDKYLLITKDGPFLHYILVQDYTIDRKFDHTNKKFKKNMLPTEASEVIIDEISADKEIKNFRLIENNTVTINSYDGFRLIFTYNTADGSSHKTTYYGFVIGNMFYSIRYNACNEAYYQKDLATFQQVLNSFRVLHARVM